MTAGHIAIGCFVLVFVILLIDDLVVRIPHWLKARKRARDMARFNLGAFKAVSRNWWEA